MFERFKEDAGRSLSAFTDTDHSRQTLYRWIFVGSWVNLFSWIVALLTPEAIAEWIGLVMDLDLSGKLQVWLLAIPFWSTFFAAYSFLRLPRYSNPTSVLENDDVLSSFRDTERNNYVRNRVLVALAASAVNTILLVFAVLALR